jgi:glycosylphosphatidylinositol deacylase
MRTRSSPAVDDGDGDGDDFSLITAVVDYTSDCNGAGGNGNNFDTSKSTQDNSKTPEVGSRLDANQYILRDFDTGRDTDRRPDTARSRRPSNSNWKPEKKRNGSLSKNGALRSTVITVPPAEVTDCEKMADAKLNGQRTRVRSPWTNSLLTLAATALAILSIGLIVHSFTTRQLDAKGCRMSYMRPAFAKLEDFDTEHTRFASKYSVYLYREVMVDEDTKVRIHA